MENIIFEKWRTMGKNEKNRFGWKVQKEKKDNEKVKEQCRKTNSETNESSEYSKKLFCKGCKGLLASKTSKLLEVKEYNLNFKCKNCQQEITCRVCDVKIKSAAICTERQQQSYIEKHLDSDEHSQKSKVFIYLNCYAKVKGFDIEKHSNINDFKFFLTALKAVTLQSPIAVMNCLSVIMSIGDLSRNHYNQLYKHVDQLVTARIHSFVCFACNFLEYEDVEGLLLHTSSQHHLFRTTRVDKIVEKHLACTKCGLLFHPANITSHKGHVIHVTSNTNNSMNSKQSEDETKPKRKSNLTEKEEENDPDFTFNEDDYLDDQYDAYIDNVGEDEDDHLCEYTADAFNQHFPINKTGGPTIQALLCKKRI